MTEPIFTVCKYSPLELLAGFGLPTERLDPNPVSFSCADGCAHPNLCGYGKAVLEEVMGRGIKRLLLVDCCDVCRRLYDILREQGEMEFLFLLALPHVEEMGQYALRASHPTPIAARCTVFAESDLVHKIQMGHPREDIIAGVCNAVAANYLNNVGKGKKIAGPVVFQGGVSKNIGVVKAFEDMLHRNVTVDENGHLMGAIGAAILARRGTNRRSFDFNIGSMDFVTREAGCGRCSNNCEIICVYRAGKLIDSWGNRCERGAVKSEAES